MIELLESRIAPAAVVTYFETDGDKIKVATSKGTNAELMTALNLVNNSVAQDRGIDFSRLSDPTVFQGTNITVSVVKVGGDGVVNFNFIDAYNASSANEVDLGHVVVHGSLGYIDCGDADLSTKALKSLKVDTMRGDNFESIPDSSDLHGDVGSILIKSDFHGNFGQSDASVKIGKLVVKGDVGGNEVLANNGRINVTSIGYLVIKGSVVGGAVMGDSNDYSGSITAQEITKLSVGHVVVAGVGTHSGIIDLVGTVTVA